MQGEQKEESKLQTQIKLIQDKKIDITLTISQFYNELRKKMNKILDKSEKLMHVKINEICGEAIGLLGRVNELSELSQIQIFQYERKTDRFLQSLQKMNLKQQLAKVGEEMKSIFENMKKVDIFSTIQKMTDSDNLVSYQGYCKAENEDIKKILYINKKLVKICENGCYIEKKYLDKQIDAFLPIKLKKKEKEKNLLLCLHEQMLAIYNDKLILQCHKSLPYGNRIKGIAQIRNHVYIVEEHKIIRIHLLNLNEIFQKNFAESVTGISNEEYNGGIVICCGTWLIYLDLDCEPYYSVNNIFQIQIMKVQGDLLIVGGESSLRIFKGINLYYKYRKVDVSPLEIMPLLANSFILITKNSHFILFECVGNGQVEHKFVTSNLFTKTIISVAFNESKVACLTESGRKIYTYNY